MPHRQASCDVQHMLLKSRNLPPNGGFCGRSAAPMEASPGSAHFRPLSLLCRHRDLPPQVLLPSPGLWDARRTPGVQPVRAVQGARCGVPNAFRGDTSPRAALAPPQGREDSAPPRLSPMETHLGVAVGSQREVLGPDFEILAAPSLHHVTGSSSLPGEQSRFHRSDGRHWGTLSSHRPGSAASGNPGWWFYIVLISFPIYPPESPPPRTPGYCRGKGRGFEAGQRAERGAAREQPRKHAPLLAPEGGPRPPGGGPFLRALRLGGGGPACASPVKPSLSGQAHPLSPLVATSPMLEKRRRLPASRAPQA